VSKATAGNFFEDFRLGQEIQHATPRTLTVGDAATYTALYGNRFAMQSSDAFAQACGLPRAPLDDLLVFHLVLGKSVPDVSRNAVANLGYADGAFGVAVYPGDTLSARSVVLGLRQTSDGKSGVVYLRTTGSNQRGESVIDYVRWVMVRKRDASAPAPETHVPELPAATDPARFAAPDGLDPGGYDRALAGEPHGWDDYAVGERIDHGDGMTVVEAEHALATRLYQNTARVHFDGVFGKAGRFGKRLVYGGHVISIVRALSFNGFANAFRIAAINGGTHAGPCFAGDTVYGWTEVLDKQPLAGRDDLGALRLRSVALKDKPAAGFTDKGEDGRYDPAVLLDLDYTVLLPRF
jgi:2-methylfumaryl-CoA hydratase